MVKFKDASICVGSVVDELTFPARAIAFDAIEAYKFYCGTADSKTVSFGKAAGCVAWRIVFGSIPTVIADCRDNPKARNFLAVRKSAALASDSITLGQ